MTRQHRLPEAPTNYSGVDQAESKACCEAWPTAAQPKSPWIGAVAPTHALPLPLLAVKTLDRESHQPPPPWTRSLTAAHGPETAVYKVTPSSWRHPRLCSRADHHDGASHPTANKDAAWPGAAEKKSKQGYQWESCRLQPEPSCCAKRPKEEISVSLRRFRQRLLPELPSRRPHHPRVPGCRMTDLFTRDWGVDFVPMPVQPSPRAKAPAPHALAKIRARFADACQKRKQAERQRIASQSMDAADEEVPSALKSVPKVRAWLRLQARLFAR